MNARIARAALIYVAFAGAYIVASDLALASLDTAGTNPVAIGIGKGLGFVVITASLWAGYARRQARYITDAEAARDAVDRRHAEVLEALPNIVFVLDADGRIASTNRRTMEVTGYTEGEIIGRPASAFIAPEGRPAVEAEIAKVVATDEPSVVENELLTASGKRIPYRWYSGPLHGPAGRTTGIAGIGVDVSTLKATEERLRRSLRGVENTLDQTVDAISYALEARDPYTAGHQNRVARLALAIAGQLGLDGERQKGLRVAAVLHDIGKLAVPSDILAKPTRLTESEMEVVRGHVDAGVDILRGVDFPWPVADIVAQHHERLDGSGYPNGLSGDKISLEGRILGVADAMEAMCSHRPYRPALGIDTAMAELRNGRGTRYDDAVVDACIAVLDGGFSFDG